MESNIFNSLFVVLMRLVFLWVMSKTAFAADTEKGGELYAIHCASCHGAAGAAVMLNAPSFDQGDSLLQADAALLKTIKNGKNAMPSYQGILGDRDIIDVVAYLRTLPN